VAQSLAFHPLALAVVAQIVLYVLVQSAGLSARTRARLLPAVLIPAVLTANLVAFTGVWLTRWHLGLLDIVLAT